MKGNRKHGYFGSIEYSVYSNMLSRCFNAKNKEYHNYGGRGITVCDRWKSGISLFVEDMGRRPSKEYSLERINVNGDYEPSNCKWATWKEQTLNQRSTKFIEYNSIKKPLLTWSEELGIKYATLANRIYKLGWTIEEAFNTDPNRDAYSGLNPFSVFECKALKGWSRKKKNRLERGIIVYKGTCIYEAAKITNSDPKRLKECLKGEKRVYNGHTLIYDGNFINHSFSI